MRIAEAMEGFEAHLRANGCSIHTVRSYLHDLGLLASWLQRSRAPSGMAHIGPHHLDRFLTSEEALFTVTGHPRGPGGLGRMRAVLRSFFRWLASTGQTRFNPAASLRVGHYSPPIPHVLGKHDEEALFEAMASVIDAAALRDRAIVGLLLGTGMRVSEAMSLNAGDLTKGILLLVQRGPNAFYVVIRTG